MCTSEDGSHVVLVQILQWVGDEAQVLVPWQTQVADVDCREAMYAYRRVDGYRREGTGVVRKHAVPGS